MDGHDGRIATPTMYIRPHDLHAEKRPPLLSSADDDDDDDNDDQRIRSQGNDMQAKSRSTQGQPQNSIALTNKPMGRRIGLVIIVIVAVAHVRGPASWWAGVRVDAARLRSSG
ncbi:hypothetical protein JDV02_000666 [Purpureocillium takamizusanense]|uniref:Uncharacterized protein n=1 Tax=Purpureocillium takamizusanense TaxID=2060973 RepID=A0A9Q8Q6J6_9HYPO|nr:uncharacterized protein JDV02_000666 [Purpureocillium takamizusanense]UNI13980.1 hypothetical protein JDV02_000666 [Purpureocillium takamizusanense]